MSYFWYLFLLIDPNLDKILFLKSTCLLYFDNLMLECINNECLLF